MATKEALYEQVAELTMALRKAMKAQLALRRENRRLMRALRAETERFEKLRLYVESLREWASQGRLMSAASTAEPQKETQQANGDEA